MTRRAVVVLALCAALSAGGGVALAAFSHSTQNEGSSLTAAAQFPPTIVSLPDLLQTAQVGTSIPVNNGSWSFTPSGFAYAWLRCDTTGAACTTLSATASSYTPAAADVGFTIRARVTPLIGGSPLGSGALTEPSQTVRTSGSGAVISFGLLPTISGTTAVGSSLSVSNGTWNTSGLTFARQWLRCDATGAGCSAITGATATTYTLTSADRGARIRVRVFATKSGLQQNWVLTQDVGPVT